LFDDEEPPVDRSHFLNVDLDLARKGAPRLRVRFALPLEVPFLLCVAGPSGSGKSSFLRMIAGFQSPDSGSIYRGEFAWFDRGKGVCRPVEERRVAYLPQNVCLFPHMTIRDNLLFAARVGRGKRPGFSLFSKIFSSQRARTSEKEQEEAVDRFSALFGIGDLMGKRVDQISGGQARKVSLARMFLKPSCLYLLDEPLTGIDPSGRRALTAVLLRLFRETATPAIWVTHSPDEVGCVADEMAEFSIREEEETMGWAQNGLRRREWDGE
jgi:ABC-type sugar transport system ATPase subunit